MKFKKLISLLAATAMAVTALTGAMSVSASEVANGTCGDGITWTLDSDGKTICAYVFGDIRFFGIYLPVQYKLGFDKTK